MELRRSDERQERAARNPVEPFAFGAPGVARRRGCMLGRTQAAQWASREGIQEPKTLERGDMGAKGDGIIRASPWPRTAAAMGKFAGACASRASWVRSSKAMIFFFWGCSPCSGKDPLIPYSPKGSACTTRPALSTTSPLWWWEPGPKPVGETPGDAPPSGIFRWWVFDFLC
jgi:hypothetical protein